MYKFCKNSVLKCKNNVFRILVMFWMLKILKILDLLVIFKILEIFGLRYIS